MSLWLPLLVLVACSLFPQSYAQSAGLFQWQFSNAQLSKSLPSCGRIAIDVKAPNATARLLGVPPYSMLAMPKRGTPTTQLIGTNESDLAWIVDQPIGAQLMLTVIDGNGNPGGVPPSLFTVIAQPTTVTVTPNVTDFITTCQPWGLQVKGGVPPYNVTLAALNSPVITNVTIGLGDDIFTYINRADPGTQLIAVVSDLQGRWATGSTLVKTQGSTNTDCIGLVSSTSNSAEVGSLDKTSANKRRATIIGVSISLALLLLACGTVAAYILWRKRRLQREVELGPDLTPRQYSEHQSIQSSGQVLSINSFISSLPRSPRTPTTLSELPPSVSRAPSSTASLTSSPMRTPAHDRDRPSFANFPTSSIRRSNKAMEAGYGYVSDSDSPSERSPPSVPLPTTTAGPSSRLASAREVPSAGPEPIELGDGELVIQHRDAGLPRELPPPYADRPTGP